MLQHDRTTCTAWDPELGFLYGTCKALLPNSIYIHAYICISARQRLLYPMHAVPCWSSPGYKLVCLSGATQLWSQNHCNYVTLLLPPNCLAKPRSHLQDGLGWMTPRSDIAAVHRVIAQACSQPALDLSSLTQLVPVSSSPAAAAVPPSFAPHHGHCSACQPELDVFALLPGLRVTVRSGTTGVSRAGNTPPMLDGGFLPPPKVPAAFPSHLSQWWTFKLDFRNREETCKRHDSSWWGLACYITGDYPVPTHICNYNICLLAQAEKLSQANCHCLTPALKSSLWWLSSGQRLKTNLSNTGRLREGEPR